MRIAGRAVSVLLRYSDRICPPEETLERVTPYLERFGVTRLARLTNLDRTGIPVWNAVVPNSRSIVINQGKGISEIDAKVSAAMEALERAVACAPAVATALTTEKELCVCGKRALLLESLLAANRSDIEPDEQIEWIRGTDLFEGGDVYVPLDAVLLDRTSEANRYWQSSDGLASGNNFEEATLHALLERIERDAEVLWRILPIEARMDCCVDPRSFGDVVLDDLVVKTTSAGLDVRVFDITSDIGVPCFTALLAPNGISTLKRPRFTDVTSGHGCHPSAVRAMIRAITEAVQSRLTYISGARDDVHPATFEKPLPPDTQRMLAAMPAPRRSAGEFPLSAAPPLMLADALQCLREAGITTAIAVRLSADHMPFSVAKVFIPELENPDGARKRRFGSRAFSRSLTGL